MLLAATGQLGTVNCAYIIDGQDGTPGGGRIGQRIGLFVTTTRENLQALIEIRHRRKAHIDLDLEELAELDKQIDALSRSVDMDERRLRRAEAPAAMNFSQIARYLGVSRHTVHDLIDEGAFPSKQLNAREVVLKSDIDDWLADLPDGHRLRLRAVKRLAS